MQKKKLAKQVVRKCIKCRQHHTTNVDPIMEDLPTNRIPPTPPFHARGVDFARPMTIKNKPGRGHKITKPYISLFICLMFDLESVAALTTNAFIAALRRLLARREKSSVIYS